MDKIENRFASSPLTILGWKVAKATIEYKTSNMIGLNKTALEYRPAKDLEYKYDQLYFTPDRKNYKRYFYYEWEAIPLNNFIDSNIKGTAEYQTALDYTFEIMAPYRAIEDEDQFKRFVEQGTFHEFITFLCKRTVQDDFNKSVLDHYSQIFENDITYGSKIQFEATMYLTYLSVEEDKLQIEPNLTIRKLNSQDLSYSTSDFYESQLDKITRRVSSILCAMELQVTMENGHSANIAKDAKKQLMKKFGAVLNSLRLFAVVNCYETECQFRTESIINHTFNESVDPPFSNYLEKSFLPSEGHLYHYQLKQKDISNFSLLLQALEPSISAITHESYFEGEPHELAYHKYRDALLRSKLNNYRLSFAIYALDAALVRSTEIKQQKNKLLTRSAYLFVWATGANMSKVRSDLEVSYKIRNRLVHGDVLTQLEKEFSEIKTKLVLNYVRVIVAIILQLRTTTDKEALIDKIESVQKDNRTKDQFKADLKQLIIPI